MEWFDFVFGFVNGVSVATLIWRSRHARFERRLNQVIATLTDEERAALAENEE